MTLAIPPDFNFGFFLNLQVQICQIWLSPKSWGLRNYSKNVKKMFCLESASGHLKKKLFAANKKISTLVKYFKNWKFSFKNKICLESFLGHSQKKLCRTNKKMSTLVKYYKNWKFGEVQSSRDLGKYETFLRLQDFRLSQIISSWNNLRMLRKEIWAKKVSS